MTAAHSHRGLPSLTRGTLRDAQRGRPINQQAEGVRGVCLTARVHKSFAGIDLSKVKICNHFAFTSFYERSHPIRGREQNAALTPMPAATAKDVIDTAKGTVHMVIGGGGTSIPSNTLFFDSPQCGVIASAREPDPKTGKRPPVYFKERAPRSAGPVQSLLASPPSPRLDGGADRVEIIPNSGWIVRPNA